MTAADTTAPGAAPGNSPREDLAERLRDLLGKDRMGKDRTMGRGWLSVPAEQLHDAADLAFWVGVGVGSGDAQT